MPPALVATTQAVAADVPVYLDEIGKTVAKEMVEIRPQASGKITAVKFEDGADVKKDQELFLIEPAGYKAALAQAKASWSQAQAQLELAQLDFDRIKDLPQAVVSRQDFDAKKNAIEVAQAQLDAAAASVQVAEVKLGYCVIKSPIDGRVGHRLADAGNVVADTSTAALLVIQKIDPIYADFTITENDLPAVRQYMGQGTLKVEARSPGDREPRYGDLTFLDNSVQDGTGTVRLRATIANPDRHFWPGQFVNVRLVLYTLKATPVIPAAAVQIGQQGTYVYVATADPAGKLHVELRPIVQGQAQASGDDGAPSLVAIKSGITANERVVVRGQMLLMPGAAVREEPPAPPAAPAGKGAPAAAKKPGAVAQATTAPAAAGSSPATTKPVAPKSQNAGGAR